MKKKHRINFLLGATFGALICAIVWYWQKSTADEDALDLLDQLAAIQAKARHYAETAVSHSPMPLASHPPFDWEKINGIGPTYAQRLRAANIITLPDLAQADPARIGEIVKLQAWQAHDPQEWIDEAQRLLHAEQP